jgi:hypothetical protein
MSYDFKPLAEGVRAVAVLALVAALQVVVATDPGKLADWRTWGIAAASAAGLAAAHGALALLTGVKTLTAVAVPDDESTPPKRFIGE